MLSKIIQESEIAERNTHLFMYGKNTSEREEFLKEVAKKHPFRFGSDEPSTVYIDEIGLPNSNQEAKDLDKTKVTRIAMSYLEFTIVQGILKSINEADKTGNEDKIKNLVDRFNMYSNSKHESLDDVIANMQKSRDFYSWFYEGYTKTGDESFGRKEFSDLDMSFIFDISGCVAGIQRDIGSDAPFQVILDRKHKIPLASVKAINTVLNMRCNGGFSAKVACEADEWETVHDLVGSFPEYVHDYSIVELDNSFKELMDKKRAEREKGWELE